MSLENQLSQFARQDKFIFEIVLYYVRSINSHKLNFILCSIFHSYLRNKVYTNYLDLCNRYLFITKLSWLANDHGDVFCNIFLYDI